MAVQPIPSRIIQTARTRNLSLKHQAMLANLKLRHPEYEHRFFDNADVDAFIDTEFPNYRRVFDCLQQVACFRSKD